jgi:FAD/FMN-containing dehydrogenase/Fe-S oxidoreductase
MAASFTRTAEGFYPPRLPVEATLEPVVRDYLDALRKEGFAGDILTDIGSRLVNATDNSIYQCLPQAVIAPRREEDIDLLAKLLGQERFRSLKLTARGGGTGTNGQALNTTVIVDFSRHLRQILHFDAEAGRVTVQPGVILDQLNAYLKPYGWFFPPNLSPSNRATLGGMVATDACGKGSRIYGKTSHYIEAMEVLLADGTSLQLDGQGQPKDEARQQPRTASLLQGISGALENYRTAIQQAPNLPRSVTGYNLKQAENPDGSLNLNRLIAGSEGTLALIRRITFRLIRAPKLKQLCILSYGGFQTALEAVPDLLSVNPLAIETLDDKVLALARGDYLWHQVKNLLPDSGTQQEVKAVHFVELVADTPEALAEQANALRKVIEKAEGTALAPLGVRFVEDAEEIASLWNIRKRCVGLLGNSEGNRRPLPFIEDTAVPPEKLAPYIADLCALLDRHGLTYGMFGHVDAGCLHVRPALDLRLEEDAALIRILSDEVTALLKRYGGVMWGEHGKGFRAEVIPQLLGAGYAECMNRIKGLFDPHNQLNPGKLAVPEGKGESVTPLDGVGLRGELDRQIAPELEALYPKSVQCNGNGACFNYETTDVMCPSYKVTGDRIHSPKGRAGLLREWLRRVSLAGAEVAPASRLHWLKLKPAPAKDDFSRTVFEALDGCLSCKGCTAQCPVKVSIPEMKSRFLDVYHRRYRRPFSDYLLRWLEVTAGVGMVFPRLMNLLTGNPLSRSLFRALGLVALPPWSEPSLKTWCKRHAVPVATPKALAALSPEQRRQAIVLVQDPLTRFFEASLVQDAVLLLRSLGMQVFLAPYLPNGKVLQVKGFLAAFRRTAERNRKMLEGLARYGVPLIGLESSVTLSYRHEYHDFGITPPDFTVLTLDEWLAGRLKDGGLTLPQLQRSSAPFRLFAHCMEKTSLPETTVRWKRILEAAGASVEVMATGCCGMAGTYGHETRHERESRALYEASWRTPVEESAAEQLLVTGFSCRCQIHRLSGKEVRHPLQLLVQGK